MIKRSIFLIALFSLVGISILSGVANAYWIWTPETKKFTNPKYAVKDSPKEQFDWAMSFYNAKDFQRAATEFEKLAKQYEFSEHASKAQYYVGLCYENMNKYYTAYQNYQKAIDNFPHIANTEEILAREFAIANLYLSKPGPKVLGTDIMAPLDRAVEIFKKIVENAPYGKFAEESQFKLGEALKKSERYEEAVQAFHKIVEDYPKSKLATQAMYEESNCAYKASLKPAYDAAATDNAIKTFEKFVDKNKDANLAKSADTTMKRLKDNVAEKSYKAAQFYESQGKTQAAIIYYQDVIDAYPDSTFVNRSKAKIEALKAKSIKKAAAPVIDLSKKKPNRVVKEKKPWSPLGFMSGKPKEKVETAAPKASPKKSWNPLGFMSSQPKKKVEPTTPQAPKKSWNPLGFMSSKPKEKTEAAIQKKPWKPLSFDSMKTVQPKKAPEAPIAEIPAPVVEAPAQPIEPQVIETPVVEAPKAEIPAVETPEKKSWKPFNFDYKKEPAVKAESKDKGWKPLYFGTNDEPMAVTNRRW